MPPPAALDAATWRSLRICVAYGLTSIAISLNYKSLLSAYQYDAKFVMLTEQLCVSLLFCAFAKRCLAFVPGLEVPAVRWATARAALLPALLFVANIVVGWTALQRISLPLFLCLRHTTTAATLLLEYAILGRRQSAAVNASVACIVLGALIAGGQRLGTDREGFAWTLANNALTASTMIAQKRFSDAHGVKGFGLVQYNALVALPFCLLGATLHEEWAYTAHYAGKLQGVRIASLFSSICCRG